MKKFIIKDDHGNEYACFIGEYIQAVMFKAGLQEEFGMQMNCIRVN